MKLKDFTVPELDGFRKLCNFTDEEMQCFNMKAKDKTNTQICDELKMSPSKVSALMRKIRAKIFRVSGWEV